MLIEKDGVALADALASEPTSTVNRQEASMMRVRSLLVAAACLAAVLSAASSAHAEFPYPACGGCADPSDYQDYLFNPVNNPPIIPSEVGSLDFRVSSLVDPSLPNTPEELNGVAGMSIDLAWQTTTGRPDVVVAILDSGVIYNSDLANKAKLNAGELPLPEGSLVYDVNGDGVFNVQDYASDSRVSDVDGNGVLDPRDLIQIFSDSVDDDANGYTDDICGWDMHEHDNDPFDDVDYGHGTGEAKGSVGEVNNGGDWGVAPSAMFIPVKVSDSFVADVNDFAAGVTFAVDSGVDIVSEALGALDNTPFAREAVEYAWDNGVPIVASAADEQSYHHNYPSAYDHMLWVNSIRPEDGFLVKDPTNLLFNGCTNYSGQATVAIASTSCSSEATEKAAGIMALLFSAAKNEIDRGNLSPHPITGRALSPSEAYQLMMQSADDIDFSGDLSLTIDPLLPLVTGIPLYSARVPSHAGYDKYTGYGRANAATAVAKVGPGTIPPEADISSPGWFETIDPTVTPLLDILGTVAAQRDSNDFTYTVDWACGVDPLAADYALPGHTLYSTSLSGTWIDDGLLAMLDTTTVETECGFDTLSLPRANEDDFDESFAITLRVRVQDTLGNTAEHRKNVFVYSDPTARSGFPKALGVSGESAPVLADVDGNGDQEIVMATADGNVHAFQDDGSELTGFPAQTELMPLETGAPAYQPAALGSDFHNAVLGSVAVGDLEPDGSPEIVAVDMEGYVYVFESDGSVRPGFPVTLDPTYSAPAIRDKANRVDMAAAAAPTLADIDLDGDLEILVAGADRHLYVWDDDGSQHPGFPVLVVDQERMQSVDPVTHKVVWKDASGGGKVGSIGTKLVGSPSVGDLDGDGQLEIVLGSNEEYVRDETANFHIPGSLFAALSSQLDLPNGRLYAISHLGNDDPAVQDNPSGPFLPGWPVRVGLALADVLPTVGHGINANPVLADIDDDGDDEIFINPSNGPAIVLQGDGTSVFGTVQDKFVPFDTSVLPELHPGSDSVDFPLSIPVVGSGVVGDLDNDAVFDFVVPGAGAGQLLDNLGPALQGPSDQQLLAYSSATRKVLPDFPRRMEDLQFLTNPTIADIDGDGVANVLQGSGGYYLQGFGGTGGSAPGWPKFTGGWTIGAIAVGDLDDDGLIDVVAATREGNLYAWEETGSFGTNGRDPVQWATVARDAHHSGNVNSGVMISGEPSGCETMYREIVTKVNATYKPAAGDDKIKVKGFVNMPGRALDPPNEIVRVAFGDPAAPTYTAEVPIGQFVGNTKGTRYKFKDKTLAVANGLKKAKLKLKKGFWNFDFQAKDVDAEWLSDVLFVSVQVGDDCMQRVRRGCEIKSNGKKLKCK
jgi:hypothetical protein